MPVREINRTPGGSVDPLRRIPPPSDARATTSKGIHFRRVSNLRCLCRKHHLLKTFWTGPRGWSDIQYPDGTVEWTSPTGHTYTTRPGSTLLFPALCQATAAPAVTPSPPTSTADRGLMMPTRKCTRIQDRAHRINSERALNKAPP